MVFIRPSADEAIAAPVRKIRELLGLNESAREFNIVYGTYPEKDTEIAILSRSVLQVLLDLAPYKDYPSPFRIWVFLNIFAVFILLALPLISCPCTTLIPGGFIFRQGVSGGGHLVLLRSVPS